MKRFFSSDLHFGHLAIIDYVPRPFTDVIQMREEIIRRWNEIVTPDDEYYLVGDLAMGQLLETVPTAARLNGTGYLIPGNHDGCSPAHRGNARKLAEMREFYGEFFTILPDEIEMTLTNGRETVEVVVCHFPYVEVERHHTKYQQWMPTYTGKWLIHGHTHEPTQIRPRDCQVHVGTDAWDYRPVPEATIVDLIVGCQ